MKQDEIREKLIDGTIHVVARDGLDKTTTKSIGSETHINEAYIYRCYSGKEDLFAKTFDSLDTELVSAGLQNISVMYATELDVERRCRAYFFAVWNLMLSNREKCLAYVRYYYSPYFQKYSYDNHKARFKPLVEKIRVAFIDEADVWMILNHMLNVMVDFSVKVHNGLMPDSDDYSEHVFRVIYASIKQYFKKPKESEA